MLELKNLVYLNVTRAVCKNAPFAESALAFQPIAAELERDNESNRAEATTTSADMYVFPPRNQCGHATNVGSREPITADGQLDRWCLRSHLCLVSRITPLLLARLAVRYRRVQQAATATTCTADHGEGTFVDDCASVRR